MRPTAIRSVRNGNLTTHITQFKLSSCQNLQILTKLMTGKSSKSWFPVKQQEKTYEGVKHLWQKIKRAKVAVTAFRVISNL